MGASPGRQLLDVVRRELVGAVNDAVAQIAGALTALRADPAFDATAFAGRVLEPVALDQPVLASLKGLTSVAGGGAEARMRGWRDAATDGAPRGIALVVSAGRAVAAVTFVPADGGPRLVVRAAGFADAEALDVPLEGGFALHLAASTNEREVAVAFAPDAPPTPLALDAGARLEFALSRPDRRDIVGIEGGPSVRFGAIQAGAFVASTPTDPFERGGQLTLSGGEVTLTPGFLHGLIPIDLRFPLNVDLRASPGAGVVLAGSPSLQTRVAGADPECWLDLALGVASGAAGAPALDVGFTTSIKGALPGLPIAVHVDGLGFRLPLSLRLGTALLPDPSALTVLEPSGAGVELDLPVVRGSGSLGHVGGELAGALAVVIPPMTASAFGVLSPPQGNRGVSFMAIIGATFPPPGVQLGFGFAISGVGGVVGVSRRIDRPALQRAIGDGSAAQLLFPSDPAGAGQAAISALPAIFPPAEGSTVAGPMLELSWGDGRMVTLSVAVLVEAATQVRLTIIGRLVVALPDPAAPLILIQATFAGFIDPAEPSATFLASLTGSHIVGASLDGDVFLLTRGGRDPTFVLSAGGFHPSFPVPRGVPALDRLSVDLSPAPWIDFRCDAYFAVTSNTLQLGLRLEIAAEVARCGLHGWLAFDALVQYSPFRFVADLSAGIALRAFGHNLVGINLALHLEGPAPYLARGRGSIDLFLFDVSFDFEIGWGSAPALPDPTFDVGGELRAALAGSTAWRARGSPPPGITLSDAGHKALSDAALVDPYGAISAWQERVPLAIEVQRFGGLPVPPQRWDVSGGQFGPGKPALLVDVPAQFAPGQFLAPASDDAALGAPAFVPLKAGVELHPQPAPGPDERPAELVWEERVVARDIPVPVPAPVGPFAGLELLELLLTALSFPDPVWWPVPEEVVTVEPVAPVAAASAWSMAAAPDVLADTGVDLAQTVAADPELMTVEAWELAA